MALVMKPGGTLVVSDGFWMNYTWKRIHHLASKLLKGIFRNGNIISLRFFYSYARFQKTLPFYEGLCFEQARRLSENALFPKLFVMSKKIILGISTICLW